MRTITSATSFSRKGGSAWRWRTIVRLEIRPNWEKGRIALEAAQRNAEQETDDPTPSKAASAAVPLDPNRLLDPLLQGGLLQTLHDLVVETDGQGRAMLELLQNEVEAAIRELSLSILTPNDPRYNLDDQIRRFDEATTRLLKCRNRCRPPSSTSRY